MASLAWVSVIAAVLIFAFVLSVFFSWILWPPEKNIPREHFAHWIRSLIRYYQDSAVMLVVAKSSSTPLFNFRRAGTEDDGCVLILEVLNNQRALARRDELLDEIRKNGYEAIASNQPANDDSLITVKIKIEDIWQVSAANRAARVAHAALDVIGFSKNERFYLLFKGVRSRERTLEARRRQKQGLDLGGTDLKK